SLLATFSLRHYLHLLTTADLQRGPQVSSRPARLSFPGPVRALQSPDYYSEANKCLTRRLTVTSTKPGAPPEGGVKTTATFVPEVDLEKGWPSAILKPATVSARTCTFAGERSMSCAPARAAASAVFCSSVRTIAS